MKQRKETRWTERGLRLRELKMKRQTTMHDLKGKKLFLNARRILWNRITKLDIINN